jgi:16S rRNA (guanine527-N7)-methyltransferase
MLPNLTTPAAVAAHFGVSRETFGRLEAYADLLRQWQTVKNLVAPSTLDVLWPRHIADSLQLLPLAPQARVWLDLGSGAGFPGLVIAIALMEVKRNAAVGHWDHGGAHGVRPAGSDPILVHLVESNARKCAFLAEVARRTRAPVEIHGDRIELLVEKRRIESVEVVTARALAPLGKLLGYAHPFLSAETRCLFLKGRDVEREIEEARSQWQFDVRLVPSQTDEHGRIVILNSVKPIHKE